MQWSRIQYGKGQAPSAIVRRNGGKLLEFYVGFGNGQLVFPKWAFVDAVGDVVARRYSGRLGEPLPGQDGDEGTDPRRIGPTRVEGPGDSTGRPFQSRAVSRILRRSWALDGP